MAEPTPSPQPAASLSTSAAKTATQAVASGAAKVVAWKTVTLATAAALGLGGGGYYMNRDMHARAQLTETEQKASALEDRAKKSELASENLRGELEQSKAEAQKASAMSVQLEKARAELSKAHDVADAEKKALEKKLADQQLQMEKLKATTGTTGEDAKLEEELKKKLADKDVLISRLKDQLKVTVASPMTAADHVTAIALFNEKNPQPQVVTARFGPRAGRAELATHMRLATSQFITAVAAMSDGSFWSTRQEVIVTLAACLEG